MNFRQGPNFKKQESIRSAVATAIGLGATALFVARSARATERAHPPAGRFISASGVNVHYLDQGSGAPLVLIHGNATSSEDFVASGIVRRLAQQYRVIVFDRPGCGYTGRPRGTDWTPMRQAALIHEALAKLDVVNPILVGHSFGSLVTAAFGIAYPRSVRALVLLSGSYFPATPFGAPLMAVPALPVVNDVLRFTVRPVLARLMSKMFVKNLFAPAPISQSFEQFPLSMSRRPSQLRATTEDANFMDPAEKKLESRYGELTLPVFVLAGDGDMVVNTWTQSKRLARELSNAHFETIAGAGHMIHHIAPERILGAIDSVDRHSQPGFDLTHRALENAIVASR